MTELEVVERRPFAIDGVSGAFERIDGVAHYAVDPEAPGDAAIVDLALAPRGDDGLVHFTGDVTVVRPLDGGRGTAVVEMPNRGRRTAMGLFNRAPAVIEPTPEIDPGDGFLFRHGFTVAWCGWQWDIPAGDPARMGLRAPVVERPATVGLRIQVPEPHHTLALTDHHVGVIGGHAPIPTLALDDPEARLLVRDGLWGQPTEVDRKAWRFVDDRHVSLDGGFAPGRIYDLVYRTPRIPVAGAGLLAARDLARHLRTRFGLDHLLASGQSQCGRFLRTFLHLGLNCGADGGPAYDGVLAHIAGGRRGEFNHRLAQPSVQPTPSFGHLFPFADDAQTDPRTGTVDGLLEPQRAAGCTPLVMYTNTSSEYWRGDASLAHTSAADGTDVEPPPGTRHYLLASTQHGPGLLPLMDTSMFGSKGANTFNIVDYTPLMRAAVINLARWVEDGVEPPPNAVPRVDDGTAVTRADALATIAAARPDMTLPDVDALPQLRPLDLGPEAAAGIGRFPAEAAGDPYPCTVSAVDDDGNEVAGIAMPDVTAAIATHTGWNPRRPDTGGKGQILDYVGSTIPLPVDEIERRYPDEKAYLGAVEAAARVLVERRHLLAEDVGVCRRVAAKRYRALTRQP
ncbi:MAG: alpha/beta hydrolase domain-containing protein [Acidimicrobiales bacterium]